MLQVMFSMNLNIARPLRFIIECSVNFVKILQGFTSANKKRHVGYNRFFFFFLNLAFVKIVCWFYSQ